MAVTHIEILVEEQSMEVFLNLLIPKIRPDLSFSIHCSRGKGNFIKNLPNRLRAYSNWLPNDWRILVLVDQDDSDCHLLKEKLEKIAKNAGLKSKTSIKGNSFQIVNRIVVEELEAWYFGDWPAVLQTYPNVNPSVPKQKNYRYPDTIAGGTWEALERILKKAGAFTTGFRKIDAAKAIAPHMNPKHNQSHSFCLLRDTLHKM